MAKYRKCYLCGERYEFCPTCWDDRNEPAWKNTFHDEDCKIIFQTCVDYNMAFISKEDAQLILKNCDLSKKESFTKDAQATIDAIMAEPEKKAGKFETQIKKVKE